MKCPIQGNEEPDFLLDYCARRLPPAEEATIDEHIAACVRCRHLVDGQRALWDTLDVWEAAPVSADFNRRLYARIEQEEHTSFGLKSLRAIAARLTPFPWRAFAAVTAVCAAFVAALLIRLPDSGTKMEPAKPRVRIEKVDMQQLERTLDDLDMLAQLDTQAAPPSKPAGSL
jgi:anti-sigma factor RsiW